MRSARSGKPGSTRVRAKVAALLISLAALWAFAAYVTGREGSNLLALSTLANRVSLPGHALTETLQDERLASRLYLADASDERRERLQEARAATDAAAATFQEGATGSTVGLLASDNLRAQIDAVVGHLAGLPDVRSAIDGGSAPTDRSVVAFTETIATLLRLDSEIVTLDDQTISQFGRAVVKIAQAQELLRQEEALLASALTVGSLTPTDHTRFTQVVANQRFLLAEALAEFPYEDVADELRAMMAGPQWSALVTWEDRVIANIANGQPGVLDLSTWQATIAPAIEEVREFIGYTTDVGLAKTTPIAIGVIVRFVLAGVLGLAAVVASIVISITTARQLVRQLERLRNAARDLASYRLPRVVERLQLGEQVDVKQEAPPLEFGNDEIGQVGEAFNQVQETAIRVAVEQAELRRSVRDVFLSLARRSQALLHRQLGLLDAMERRTTDAEELAELFRIDHLATRMRRNAENLIVLSGATAGRAWRKPVPIVDVLRGALAEVEDYTRVTVLPVGNASLLGRAVGDVIHLLAELIENAVSFSPPQTTVRVGGSVVGYGFAIEIEDRGLGMSPEELAAANEQLRDPPEFRLTSTARLGLYVVAKLAERHGIRVRLTESAYGGTTAVVLLPGSILAEDGVDGATPPDPSQLDSYRPAQLAGVGRHRLQSDKAERARSATAVAVRDSAVDSVDSADRTEAPVAAGNAVDHPSAPPATNGSNGRPELTRVDLPAPAPTTDLPTRPAQAADAEAPQVTPSGLPFRRRRAAAAEPAVADQDPGPATPSRDPDATRSLMASYRSGTLRGRSDAARMAEEQAGPPPVAPAPDDPGAPPGHPDPQWTQPGHPPPGPGPESPQWTESTSYLRETEEGG